MPSLESLWPFFLATAVFALLPGPALLYTAAQTISGGRRGGFRAALGIHIGGFVHVLAAAAGLSAVFQLIPALYAAVKLVGALYLIFLGLRMLQRALKGATGEPEAGDRSGGYLWQSMLVEVLNPKSALFFLAFLPQFADPSAGLALWLQLLILGVIVNLAFTLADLVTVCLTGAAMAYARDNGRLQRCLKALGGTVLIGLGLRLALERD